MSQQDVWKEFEQNPVTHSAAHHLEAIAALRQTHGYARVSDVARRLNISRGSVSLTLKALKQRGLVAEDENRFLLLSERGSQLAAGVRAKKEVIGRLLQVLHVPAAQASVDTCKIEHLVSGETAQHVLRFLRFVESTAPEAHAFREAWAKAARCVDHDASQCPICEGECLSELLTRVDDEALDVSSSSAPSEAQCDESR